jgi:carboxylesterase
MSQAILPKPFDGSDHQSLFWQESDRAALLVHGFPGTPAEMHPLGTILKEAGWTVRGLMLPGLGADIEKLDQRTSRVWLDAVQQAIERVEAAASGDLVGRLFLGRGLGVKRSAGTAAGRSGTARAFLEFRRQMVQPPLAGNKFCFPRLKPLKRADFAASEVRHGLQRMFKNIDLENPQIQQALRQLTVSSKPIEQIRQLGQRAFNRVAKIDVPTLIIQGSRDKVVPPIRTQRLINRFVNRVEYHEVDAGHDLVDPGSGAWDQVKEHLLRFAASLRK